MSGAALAGVSAPVSSIAPKADALLSWERRKMLVIDVRTRFAPLGRLHLAAPGWTAEDAQGVEYRILGRQYGRSRRCWFLYTLAAGAALHEEYFDGWGLELWRVKATAEKLARESA
jgi:hypothetical protein